MKYDFVPFDKKPDKRFPASTYDGITVRQDNSITVGKAGWHRFEGVKQVELSYDIVKGAIYVEPNDTGNVTTSVDKRGENRTINANLRRVIPTGRYYFKENRGKGYLFVRE
jgi:hypothetical protein